MVTSADLYGRSPGFPPRLGPDGKMVWSEEGAMMGKAGKSTTTITAKGKKVIDIQYEMGDMSGTDHCTKS